MNNPEIKIQMEALTLEYNVRSITSNSPKDGEKLNDILRKMEDLVVTDMAITAYRIDPLLSLEEHKALILMQYKLGVYDENL